MPEPEVQEIREQAQGGSDEGDDGGSDSSGMFDGAAPSLGLSRQQMLIIGVVVAGGVAFYVYQRRSTGSEIDEVRDVDSGNVELKGDTEDTVVVEMPKNPDDELDNDQAVLDMMVENGHVDFGGDD